jgi:hypothetical protein
MTEATGFTAKSSSRPQRIAIRGRVSYLPGRSIFLPEDKSMSATEEKKAELKDGDRRTIDGIEFEFKHRKCPKTGVPYLAASAVRKESSSFDARTGRVKMSYSDGTSYHHSPGEDFAHLFNNRQAIPWDTNPRDPRSQEIRKMREAGFHLAADFFEKNHSSDQPAAASPLLDLAMPLDPIVHVSRVILFVMEVKHAELMPYLRLHASGDWGESLGLLSEAKTQITDDARAIPGRSCVPQPVRNAISIERGFGIVRSSYAIGRNGMILTSHPNINQHDTLDIASLLVPGKPAQTFVFSGQRG